MLMNTKRRGKVQRRITSIIIYTLPKLLYQFDELVISFCRIRYAFHSSTLKVISSSKFNLSGTNEFLVEYDNGNVVSDNDKYSRALAEKHINLNVTLGFLGNSDYLPFEALGYTVIGLHDDGVTKNPDHHTTADTPDTLNYEYLTSTTKLVLATILNLDRLITTE